MMELRNCPFCGGEAEIGFKRSCYNHWKPEGFYPRCKDTKCIGRVYRKYHTEKAARDAWNRRVGDDLMERMEDGGKKKDQTE